jgi:hypothetical protein
VTTTPVPNGIAGLCNKTTGQGGCPPRRPADPAVYNAAAAAVVAAHNSEVDARNSNSNSNSSNNNASKNDAASRKAHASHARRIATLDLNAAVAQGCGVAQGAAYDLCPANCRLY